MPSCLRRHPTVLLTFGFMLTHTAIAGAQSLLVENGQPRSEIVIADAPSRSTRLAAAELQSSIQKISGARLPIVFAESSDPTVVHIHVGATDFTRKLGIDPQELKFGAYRMVSGDDWLVLVGDDTEFVPREPWARNNSERVSGKLQQAWEQASGTRLGVPDGGMYKNRARLPAGLGLPYSAESSGQPLEIWGFDERGSFNAVCDYLRSLGVRWYLPGELGEVVPRQTTLHLPRVDRTVHPDFPIRQFNVRFGTADNEVMMWAMRLGLRSPYGLMIAHGMHTMTHTERILAEHPEWFALYGGRRDNRPGERLNHLCYSNEQLFQATVEWARAQFDVYDFEAVSIMPPDAYISICQCPLCSGLDVPEMGSRGKLSNHVWDFVNRVAREVRKTHPHKKIVCCAYGANTLPPSNIDRLEPNVQVVIVGGRRPRDTRPEQREAIRQLRADWQQKTDNRLMIFENYPITDRGFYLPAFVAATIGDSINATKGSSLGEDIWLSFPRTADADNIGFDHFQIYFTARMYWGGADQDARRLLEEYCHLFYGPAGPQMQEFFEYCEEHWQDMEHDADRVGQALGLFAAARQQVADGSIPARRLELVDRFLDALRSKAALLAQTRGPVPRLRTVWAPKEPIVIDGHLDDQYWQDCPTAATGTLRELQTGRQPVFGTSIKAGWHADNLYFAIRCEERPGEPLNIATRRSHDQAMWYGDLIEIELDTDSHSYYQIAVNPAGALIDLDRGASRSDWFGWDSRAEVATQISDDHWTVEIRIPVTNDANDPLNQVVGRKPSQSLPWHFNVCRQRVRAHGAEYSAFSPTGTASFHEPMKFAYLYEGRSHQFDVDPDVKDYLIASREVAELMRQRQYPRAIDGWLGLLESFELTDLQKSDALQQAVQCALLTDDFAKAEQLIARIPIPAVAKTARMELLLAQRRGQQVIVEYGSENLAEWPFWQIGQAARVRGTACSAAGKGEQAESDFQLALEFTSDSRTRLSLLGALAGNRERVLKDDPRALQAYQRIVASTSNPGSAEYFGGVQGAARILARLKRFDEALETLDRVDPARLRGFWKGSLLLSRAATLEAADRRGEAERIYRSMLTDDTVDASHRRTAEDRLAP